MRNKFFVSSDFTQNWSFKKHSRKTVWRFYTICRALKRCISLRFYRNVAAVAVVQREIFPFFFSNFDFKMKKSTRN